MRLIMLILAVTLCFTNGYEIKEKDISEARGKGKYALLIHFFYVAASKLFVLKIIYGAIFYVIVYKAWHLVLWLIKYMKENKHDHYVEYDHNPVYDYDPYGHGHHGHDHHGHGHHGHDHGYGHNDQYGPDFNEPYGGYERPIYGRKGFSHKNKVYDADGSYSVQS
ncbi:uncharacterized protein LOC119838826 [Zerene cesonia]|uniref:uncharacterized protein LOC119838826 n=1 Tax=Zerene cesonia TaxID=33412 RepID=UPI0018E590AC|nr:uncharacterized protein LOC119838826 [Zerene cesonia]